jgi:hypothetical protein
MTRLFLWTLLLSRYIVIKGSVTITIISDEGTEAMWALEFYLKEHLEKPLWEIWQIFAEVKKIFDKGEKSFPEFINEKYIIQIWEMQKMLRKYVKFSK